jgi:tetratricopeptide (TPR) repeat protein
VKTRSTLLIAAVGLFLAACATTTTQAPVAAPSGEHRFLIDPRTGSSSTASSESVSRKFDTAWQQFQNGQVAEARRRFADLRSRAPELVPIQLAEAAVDLAEGRTAVAHATVDQLAARNPEWTAALVYQAEIAAAEGNNRRAYDIYRTLAGRPDLPAISNERAAMLRDSLFNDLYRNAQTATDEESVRLLRDALEINPAATDARLLLSRKLIAGRNFDDARRTLDPLVNSAEMDRPEVQEALAEIDAGRGRYQEAIVRYDRLARRTRDPRYTARLEEIKTTWTAANMPPQFTAALESPELTRADFAVLLYWTVPSVRFAQNLGTPPIAIDIGDVAGRDEIIRAIAFGLYDVDSVTRRVSPARPVTAANLTKLAARVLTLRAADCARNAQTDPAQILAACGINDPTAGLPPDALVTGRQAAALLSGVEKALAK